MRLIDRQGRLFGLVNIIDGGAVAFLIAVVFSFTYAYRHLHGRIPMQSELALKNLEYHWLDFEVTLHGVEPEVVPRITIGDQEVVEPGQPIAQIRQVGVPTPDVIKIDWSGTTPIQFRSLRKVQLPITVRLLCGVRDGQLYFRYKKLMKGSEMFVETKQYAVHGVVEVPVEYFEK